MTGHTMTASELLQIAETLSTVEETRNFLDNVAASLQEHAIEQGHAQAIIVVSLQTLLESTRDDAGEGEEAIFSWILPACLLLDTGSAMPTLDAHRMRELLPAWIEQYPDEKKVPLRARVLTKIDYQLDSTSPEPALWCVSAIGLRTPRLEYKLKRMARRNDAIGDGAIECLAGLNPAEETRKELARRVLRRLESRKARQFWSVITKIGDKRFIPALSRKLRMQANGETFIAGMLGQIANHAPLDADLQNRVWNVLRRALHGTKEVRADILFTGDGISHCNTKHVIATLVQILDEPEHGSHLALARIRDCVRPTQLEGWSMVDKRRLRAFLMPAATTNTGNSTLSMTVQDHDRRHAWDTCFAAGIRDIKDWFEAALTDASGPFEKKDALEFSSFYQWSTWPAQVENLVRQEFRLEDRQGQHVATRTAAVQFLFGTGSLAALELLLRAGITIQGSPLRSTAQAVADLAAWLARQDEHGVVERLLSTCDSRELGDKRMLAIAGLQSLADQEQIPGSLVPRLAEIAQDTSLPPYAIAAAIWASGCFSQTAQLQTFIAFLTRQIESDTVDIDVKFQSFQLLIRLGIWHENRAKLHQALGLEESLESFVPSSPNSYRPWQALLLAQLAVRSPEEFLAGAITILDEAGPDAVHGILQVCARTHEDLAPVAYSIAQTAIQRILRVFSRSYAETDTFFLLCRISPNAFASAPWEDVWDNWMADARAALTRAIEMNTGCFASDLRPRILILLEKLLSDSAYQVRRIAARAYSVIDIATLSDLCDRWSESGNTGLRSRAADIAQYLPADQSAAIDNRVLRLLKQDPEKRIREAALRSCTNLRNRVWAGQHLDVIKQGSREDPNGWVGDCYRYGRALTTIGDDETLDGLRSLTADTTIPPNVRNWLRSLETVLEERWKEVTRSWPEPSLPWAGVLEEEAATITVEERLLTTRLLLWKQRPSDPRGAYSWGGSFFESPGFDALTHFVWNATKPTALRIRGRNDSLIWISSAGTNGMVSFVGTGPYPEVLEPPA